VLKINHEYVRVILIDPGFTVPANREAVIHLQHLYGTEATDMLSKEKITINGDRINVSVPAGVFRVVDILVEPKVVSVGSFVHKSFTCPTVSNGIFNFVNNCATAGQLEVFDITGSKLFSSDVQPGESIIRLPNHCRDIVIFSFIIDKDRHSFKHIIVNNN
jgi:hypothetical protein